MGGSIGYRPVVAIKGDKLIKDGGDGTAANPFVVAK
jgi:hypothetical protein